MLSIYFLAIIASVVALGGWIYNQNKEGLAKRFQLALFAGLGLYLLSVITIPAALDQKMGVVFRDLLVIGVSGAVFLYVARLRKLFFVAMALIIGGIWVVYKTQWQQTLQTSADSISLSVEGELLVELQENQPITVLDDILKKYDLSISPAFNPVRANNTDLDDYYLVDVADKYADDLQEIKDALMASGLVDWVEDNEVLEIEPMKFKRTSTINKKFGINDPGIQQLWGFDKMEMDQLYNYLRDNNLKPKKKALIAILDTGVDAKHEDIKANFSSIKRKYDNDPKGHGTHCAGIAAAVSNNGVGVASFSHDNSFVKVTSIKVLNSSGMGTQQGIIKGIIEAADNGAAVISMSLGGRSNQSKQTAYEKAVKYANDAGAIVIAAAGNSNRNAKEYAPVNAKGIIGVSAINPDLNRAVFSNYVTDIPMGVAAPGVNIYSTLPGNKYASLNGTSMATPYVAGLVGLMKSLTPELTTADVYQILDKTGKKTKSTDQTGKLIYPVKAVETLVNR